ncbi:MAG: CHAT domain-containing protein [Symploca sp. SIO3C6]|nr:CHAT domain-containing protein [Symploca sp. SIO3C6]
MLRKYLRYFLKVNIFNHKLLFRCKHTKAISSIVYSLLFSCAFLVTSLALIPTTNSTTPDTSEISANPQTLVQQGKAYYDAQQFIEAIEILKQAAEVFKNQGDHLQQAMTLNNLALAYQQLGQWSEAQAAITSSLELLQNPTTTQQLQMQGAALDLQGQIYLAQGQPDSAGEYFSTAAATYTQAGDEAGVLRSQINYAQALQASGMYRRALEILQQASINLQKQPDSVLKATSLRSLGRTQRLIGNLEQSQDILEQSLEVAQAIGSPQDISAALLSLGNIAKAKADNQKAWDYYQQAAANPKIQMITRIQAQLNLLSLLIDTPQKSITAPELVSQIQAQIAQLPPSHASVGVQLNLASALLKLENQENIKPQTIAELLSTTIQEARIIKDQRGESYALGQLAVLYEKTQQLKAAQELTEKALLIAQSIQAPEISYNWQWQLGRLLQARGETKSAIAAYTSAVSTLESVRSDIVSMNPEVQFSFRESVEPIYRELVGLLLKSQGGQTNRENLEQALKVIESLQQAELVNFFREDCLDRTPVQIDEVDKKAVVLYPIVLKDRLEVVVSLPNSTLRHYATFLPQTEVEEVFIQLQQEIAPEIVDFNRGPESWTTFWRPSSEAPQPQEYLNLAQRVYDWLIRPVEQELAASKAETLVFVLDGPLLNLPMAVLHDGQQFLIEKYAIALTPGLQLLDPKPLPRGKLTALKAGITKAREDFPPLPFVERELEQIKLQLPGELLLDQQFTSATIAKKISSVPFPVVHLATHGQFSSNAQETFILTWDQRLNIDQLRELLRSREERVSGAIELLVLSACQTATGDKRAALGLAGVAVRAGARSTLATLWLVDDRATAELMIRFYRQLTDTKISKAEALRRAQVSLLKDKYYQHPRLWAPFVLVGNWL